MIASLSYFAGDNINFTMYLLNGYAVTFHALTDSNMERLEVKAARIDYRYLKLDPRLADSQDVLLSPEEIITLLTTVQSFTLQTGIPEAEQMLRKVLNRPA